MKEFTSNELLRAYVDKQRTMTKKLMGVLGPLGAGLILYWMTNIFRDQPVLRTVSVVALCAAHFHYCYWSTLTIDSRFMNRLVEGCQVQEHEWTFTTVGWFLKKPLHCQTRLIQEIVCLNSSFFKQVGPVYKISFVAAGKFEHVYLLANAFEEFAQLLALLERSLCKVQPAAGNC